jgi:hypothetical protein
MVATVFIGAAAGFAGDRTDAAGPVADALASCPGPRFLMFETLAERTLALSQLDRQRDPDRGFNPALDRFVGPVLARCSAREDQDRRQFRRRQSGCGCRAYSGMAREQGLPEPRIAMVEGDDLTGVLSPDELAARETGGSILRGATKVVAANPLSRR